ncbi:uroporphyrinogen-III synthase [Macrococcoides caseolyticum]|uniref:uroporphyrinogen-III synthase n=1 Tax=Macrococcoides caseolyticum TaxID=69966 RepID=UPI001F47D21A|nr:uroporphyrinogen-III synthase [Macrococcus caseolyticus]MCE4956247.1 uroporphyrinogen-III synthase [Macrococcus caseolyticus]
MKPIVLMTDSKPYKDARVEIIHLPFIKMKELPIQHTRQHYDWLIFTSKNAVDTFFSNYPHVLFTSIAAIGEKTKAYLEDKGYPVDFVPSRYNQECFIAEMGNRFNEKTIGLPVSSQARPHIYNALKSCANVDRIELYEPVANHENVRQAIQFINAQHIHWITFMSPSSVAALNRSSLHSINVMAIGHVTSDALKKKGIQHYISALETKESMISTIINIEHERKGEIK